MNGPSKLAAPISSKQFLDYNYVFSVQVWYICLHLIDLNKKVHFAYSKLNLRPKNCFLEIRVSNLEGPYDLTFCAQSCTAH